MEFPSCLYGGTHAGDAFAVRSQRGVTLAGLCADHKRKIWDIEHNTAYHLRTWQELAEREDKHDAPTQRDERVGGAGEKTPFRDDAREDPESEGVHRRSAEEWEVAYCHNPSTHPQSASTVRERPAAPSRGREDFAADALGYDIDIADRAIARPTPPRESALGKEIAPLGETPPPRAIRVAGPSHDSFSAPLEWWAGAGELVLEDWQRDILWQPFDPTLFEQRFDGLWYLPWVHAWRRLLETFAPSVPQLVPIGEPKVIEETVCVHYAMLVNGQFLGEALGECSRKGANKRLTWPSAIEGCVSDAITRIGKRLGMNLELWQPATLRALKEGGHRA